MPAERRALVITVSDRVAAGKMDDLSGPEAVRILAEAGFTLVTPQVTSDDPEMLEARLRNAAAERVELVVTTGGTGLSPRDLAPQATQAVADYLVPGLSEAMRAEGSRHTPFAWLSRGVCAVRGATLILNLPGNPRAVRESLESVLALLPHALDQLSGDNLAHPG
ncbi:MAG: MogA/MoaB family molybdenum cofactor biosynthesis protein [Candidatus Dormibacteria bacterium]